MGCEQLTSLTAGMAIPFGGDRLTRVSDALAAAFRPGDRLIVVQETGELLHVPAAVHALATAAVSRAAEAFSAMGSVSDAAISAFFVVFARRLVADDRWAPFAGANAEDRLPWRQGARPCDDAAGRHGKDARQHDRRTAPDSAMRRPSRGRRSSGSSARWLERRAARLRLLACVVGFVFEGRPNVFADAAGVLRGGNTVVFRIGSDALGTAKAIVEHALAPALETAALPAGACVLVDSAEHAAGWALFSDARLGLAVARGSGHAVAQLGAVARQAGVPVSLHGDRRSLAFSGSAADETADAERFAAAVAASVDRKVCNTLNVCCIVRSRAAELVPLFLAGLGGGEPERSSWKLHVAEGDEAFVPERWRSAKTNVRRAGGLALEHQVEPLPLGELGREWEWETTPEATLKIVDSLGEAIALFNRYSPRFSASLISENAEAQERFYAEIEAGARRRWHDPLGGRSVCLQSA